MQPKRLAQTLLPHQFSLGSASHRACSEAGQFIMCGKMLFMHHPFKIQQ
jgi:hypothetical protein